MKSSLSLNILRLSLLLVLVGFFLPIACDSNGYQIAQGILGGPRAGNAVIFEPIEDIYGYFLFGVFAFALLGIVFTFLGAIKKEAILGWICLAFSFVLLTLVALKLKSIRDSAAVHLLLTVIPVKVRLLVGGYSMAAGYLGGVIGLLLRLYYKGDTSRNRK